MNLKCPICQNKWTFDTPFDTFDCSFCESEIKWKEIIKIIEKELLEKFLKRIDWILERIEFHTENPDSELIDEISEEYKKWEWIK